MLVLKFCPAFSKYIGHYFDNHSQVQPQSIYGTKFQSTHFSALMMPANSAMGTKS